MKLPRRQAIPLADTQGLGVFARRMTAVRIVLASALVAALGAAALLSHREGSGKVRLAKGADSGVVVVDLSASIGAPGRRGVAPLEYLAETGQDFGLILFSGIAYEMVPPGTSSEELGPIISALAPLPGICVAVKETPCPPGTRRVLPATREAARVRRLGVTPWNRTFRGGTVISAGLQLGREALERHHMSHRGVLLISDLDDSLLDVPQLTRELIVYERKKIPIHVVALDPFGDDRFFFERMLGKDAFVDHADLTPPSLVGQRRGIERAGVSGGLAALALLLLMLLALNEHFCGRLAWRVKR